MRSHGKSPFELLAQAVGIDPSDLEAPSPQLTAADLRILGVPAKATDWCDPQEVQSIREQLQDAQGSAAAWGAAEGKADGVVADSFEAAQQAAMALAAAKRLVAQ